MNSLVSRTLLLAISLASLITTGRSQIDANVRPTYEYPDQLGREELIKSDPKNLLLTDDKSGPTGEFAVWGKWDVKKIAIDWKFEETMKINRMEVILNHPSPDSNQCHPNRVAIYVGNDEGDFPSAPDLILDIPFEAGANQTVDLDLPDGAIVGKRIRTEFQTDQNSIALCEVKFDASPADVSATTKPKAKSSLNSVAPVQFLPAPMPSERPRKAAPFFGVCGHMMHTDFFFRG